MMKNLLILVAASAALLGCPAVEASPNEDTVATIDGVAITRTALEATVKDQLDALERQRQQLLEDAVGPLVEQRLLEGEAKRKGLTAEELVRSEVEAKVTPATEAEIDQWFFENQTRIRGSKEQVAPQIRTFLEQQRAQQLRTELVAELRSEHDVVILLEPLRVELALEGATLKGPAEAPVTIVEFSDFQCPACQGFNPTIGQIQKAYGDKVQIAFRQYPLRSIHPQAQKAAEASLCARDQGKFWELHDVMFSNQAALQVEQLKASAGALGVDADEFARCLDSGRHEKAIQDDIERGDKAGVSGTPSVYVNGRPIGLGRVPSFPQLAAAIDDELARGPKSPKP